MRNQKCVCIDIAAMKLSLADRNMCKYTFLLSTHIIDAASNVLKLKSMDFHNKK